MTSSPGMSAILKAIVVSLARVDLSPAGDEPVLPLRRMGRGEAEDLATHVGPSSDNLYLGANWLGSKPGVHSGEVVMAQRKHRHGGRGEMVRRRIETNLRPRRTAGLPNRSRLGDLPQGDPELSVLDARTYSIAAVARLTGLHPKRVGRWLQGYRYEYEISAGPVRHGKQGPVIQRPRTGGTTYASFLDLVDLLFVREFLKHGVSLQKVRVALDEATELLGTDHFARQTFFTDGRGVYLQLVQTGREKAKGILELMTGGQWTIAPIIQELASRIDFHEQTGFARRWHPWGREGFIVIDPCMSFGRPSIVGRGIATENVYDFYLGEQEQIEPVCRWMGLQPDEVRAAVVFEQQMAA